MRLAAAVLLALAAARASAEQAPSCDTPQACEAQCRKGNAASCSTLGVFLLYTAQTEQRKGVALKAFERACAGQNEQGCEYAARMLADKSPRRDPQKARAHAERGCRLGSQKCCELAAIILAAAPAPREYSDGPAAACGKAAECAKKCDADDGHACHLLGLYRSGGLEGAPVDLPRARSALLRACSLGDADACDSAAALAQHGQGGEKDAELSLELRRRGCDLGRAAACSKAADQMPQEPRAAALRKRACKLNARECL
jgi:TPR repeat protein